MPSFNDLGTSLYTVAIANTAASTFVFGAPAAAAAAVIGTMFSSPSDMEDAANKWRGMNEKIDKFKSELTSADKSVTAEQWQNIGRDEYSAVLEKFQGQLDKTKSLNGNLAGALDHLAGLSLFGAGASAVGSLPLVGFAIAAVTPSPLSAGAKVLGSTYVAMFRLSLSAIAKKHLKALMVGAAIGATVMMILQSQATENFTKAMSPTSPDEQVDFTQVNIENLPPAKI